MKIDFRQRTTAGPTDFDGKGVGLLGREINVPEGNDQNGHLVLDIATLEVPVVKRNGG